MFSDNIGFFYLSVKPFKSFIKQAIDPTKLESRLFFCDDNKCALIKSVKLTDNYDCMSKKLSILFNISFAEKNGTKTETKTLETEGYIPPKTAFLNSDEIDIHNERDTDCRKYRKQNYVFKFFYKFFHLYLTKNKVISFLLYRIEQGYKRNHGFQ